MNPIWMLIAFMYLCLAAPLAEAAGLDLAAGPMDGRA